jgi:hypothetical protein
MSGAGVRSRRSVALALLLAAACMSEDRRTPAAEPARDELPPEPEAPASPELDVRRSDRPGGARWTVIVGGCVLALTLEGARMWWSADATETGTGTECTILSPLHRGGWIALADAARHALPRESRIGLVVDFHAEPASIERWFRHQAASPEIQALLRGHRGAAVMAEVAEHMQSSGALARYAELLEAMGLSIVGVSIEKVELRPARDWRNDLPASAEWALPPDALCALPFLTWVDLRAR